MIMKKLIFMAAALFACFTFKTADAQLHVRLGLNIGSQPDWGPVGYDHADYYYMPDIDAYYDVSAHQYVYYNNNAWIHASVLPARYSNFDRYHSYKVVVNERNPWLHHAEIRSRYANFKGRHDQAFIRDSHDAHYRNHWREDHNRHVAEHQRDHNRHEAEHQRDHNRHEQERKHGEKH
jgi:hypothetical protein